MAIYSIKDLEKLCGIKAHTLRIWEQRYSLIQPKRTKTNIRYYQDSDLQFLLHIALLNRNGYKISKIAKMSKQEISERVADISEIDIQSDNQLDALTLSMIEMDDSKFNKIVSTNINQIGFEETITKIIYPFLEKLNVLWLTGSIKPIQENFITLLIRQKIIFAIDQLPDPKRSDKNFIIYLPEGENDELSLHLMHYLLKKRNFKTINLGKNISIHDLIDAHHICKPEYIYTMISESFSDQPVKNYVDALSTYFPNCKILLSGYQIAAQKIQSDKNIQVLNSLDETVGLLDNLSSQT